MKKRLSLVAVTLLIVSVVAGCGSDDLYDSPPPTSLPTIATVRTTQAPTPTQKPASNTHAYLGSTLQAFKQAYGTPTEHSNIVTTWQGNHLSVVFYHNGVSNDITYRFTLSSEAPGSHNVPLSQAKKVCEGFRPLDSQLVRTKRQPRTAGLPDGIQYIYVSKVFAQVVNDDNEFRDTETTETGPDGALPTTAPGTFTLFYLGNDSTGYGLCFLTVGINWPAG